MKAALLQITSSDDPSANLAEVTARIEEAAAAGAGFILTPEVTNVLSTSRRHQRDVLRTEAEDPTLAGLREAAARLGIWLSIGSLALKTDGEKFANRGFIVAPDGSIRARYDKLHMFDVEVSPEETYRESDAYQRGDKAVVVETPFGTLGLSICYDIRFPHLYRALAKAGATIILVPAAFSYETGAAHWEPLLRARAIENTAYVLAAAQTGLHPASQGKQRRTHGHTMVVSPWGEVLCDAGTEKSICYIDLDPDAVAQARKRVPSLGHDVPFQMTHAK